MGGSTGRQSGAQPAGNSEQGRADLTPWLRTYLLRYRWPVSLLAVLTCLPVLAVVITYSYDGWYGVNVMLRRGANYWVDVAPDDPRLSAGIRVALDGEQVPDSPQLVAWRTVFAGLDVADLPVYVSGRPVDAIMLTRIDPDRFEFHVMNRPAGDRDLGDWMDATGAVAVINGSYYADRGAPETPLISDGRQLGPHDYRAIHGLFRSGPTGTSLEDLTDRGWRQVIGGADQAAVSYPLLIGADGRSRAQAGDPRWLANRSFIAEDADGRIILGTTKDAYFSLNALADFLPRTSLGLRLALNLDGGPVACQGVHVPGYQRRTCGQYELAVHHGHLQLLQPLVNWRLSGLANVLLINTR
jgi:hypothetical protein